jgi:AAA family ATP:ADP antiporter
LFGGIGTSLLVTQIGFHNLFPIAATMLLVAVFCINRLRHWVEEQHRESGEQSVESSQPLGGTSLAGITHVVRSKYFIAIASKSVIASLLGTALYMFTAELVQEQIATANEQTQFFSNINNFTNALTFVGQFLIVKQVVARFGIGVSLSMLPIVSIAGFAMLAFEPTLAVLAILTVVRRSLGFAFSKPTSDMLYSVVTPEEKYKAKNFIDTVVYRTGDLIGTWTVRFLVAGLGLVGATVVMLPFAAIWAWIALWIGREYKRRDADAASHA